MKLQHILTLIAAPIFFTSCEEAKKEESKNTPAQVEKKADPTGKKQPPKTGIPAVEAVRGIGKDLDKEAQKSKELLDGATGK